MVTFSVIGCSSSEVDSSKEQATSKDEKQVVVATSVAITEILDRLGVEAVSYTHLDVYKRQILYLLMTHSQQ